MATVCAALHRRAGEDPVTGTGVAGLRGTAAVTGEGRLPTPPGVGSTLALRGGIPTTTVA